MTIIDDRYYDFCVYSVFNTGFLGLMLSTMSKLYQKTGFVSKTGFVLVRYHFLSVVCELLIEGRISDCELHTRF